MCLWRLAMFTMYYHDFTAKLNPAPTDPMQAKMMKFLPYIFLILFASFPAGLVIYWTFNNGFSIAQQYIITKKN